MQDFFSSKATRLWLVLSGFFVANALVAEYMGVKLFSLERTFGFQEVDWSMFGQDHLSFILSAGVLLWPAVFIMTDLINEYYGPKGVRTLSFLTAGLIAYGFIMLFGAIGLEPADFWRTAHIKPSLSPEAQTALRAQVSDYSVAYNLVFGQSRWIIVGSLIAFLLGQIVDVTIFHRIKAITGEGRIWLRSTGSTLVSQLIDTFVVGIIALYYGQQLPFIQVLASCLMGYAYKSIVAVLMTPVIYLVHSAIERYLGPTLAAEMRRVAQQKG